MSAATVSMRVEHPMDAMKEMTDGAIASSGMAPPPARRVERNMSGPQGAAARAAPSRRAPPKRSHSHKIGRPAFNPAEPAEQTRGVNRSHSNRVKAAPLRTGSFNRRGPDRSSSTSSLRRRHQPGTADITSDDISVTDSVFTSASNQTQDSIMLRKQQIDTPGSGGVPLIAGSMRGHRPQGTPSFEFDESLHTVDSMQLHHRHVSEEYYDDQCDLSVFSESFCSTESYEVLSDYEEEEMGGAIDETDEVMRSDDGDESME
jgi:hypothetical protein